ncbi:MAG: hypothetical protein KKB39_04540 [Nanoarchaeota archaeon]|nr:hypothetical protein [Nanoarchaeota archaeon]
MKKNLYLKLCSYENLLSAFKKARKKKTKKDYVRDFEKNLKENLLQLKYELLFHAYKPKPLNTFILRDPKTRKISKSEFIDRVVHHALYNIIEPIFERRFIYDSYANRKTKGTLKAIKRFNYFKRKVSKNNKINCFVLKADIKHYFETINHKILLSIIKKRINDEKIIWLIKMILNNYKKEKGMPLGNLTSQFFANVYLNELDQFVKHKLRIKHYVRYVDDFVIFCDSRELLLQYQQKIIQFLKRELKLEIHPFKSKIVDYKRGIDFLGLRIFPYHMLLKKKNLRKFRNKLDKLEIRFFQNKISYDKIYDFLEGWTAYSKTANSYKLRIKILKKVKEDFTNEISIKEINRYLKPYN